MEINYCILRYAITLIVIQIFFINIAYRNMQYEKFKTKYETTGHRFVTKIISLDNDSWNQSSVAVDLNKPG